MTRNEKGPVITGADMAASRARRAGRSTLLQRDISSATRDVTTSLSEIAREAGVSDSTLSSWRRGVRVPTPDALEVLADVLDERADLIRSHAAGLRDHAAALRTSSGRANLLLDGVLRDGLRSHFLETEFERALAHRVTESNEGDHLAEAKVLAVEMITAAKVGRRPPPHSLRTAARSGLSELRPDPLESGQRP